MDEQQERDSEIAKIIKSRLLIQELRRINVDELKLDDSERMQVSRALKLLAIFPYLHSGFNDSGSGKKSSESILNIDASHTSINLSVDAQKAVHEALVKNIQAHLTPVVEMGQTLQTECPEIFTTDDANVSSTLSTPLGDKILALSKRRQEAIEKLARLRRQKCELLKTVADLKVGPHLSNELSVMCEGAQLNQGKANVLRSYFLHELMSGSDYSPKAFKVVRDSIDEELQRKEQLNKEKQSN